MTVVSNAKENAGDILADAKNINEERIKAEEVIEDTSVEEVKEGTAE